VLLVDDFAAMAQSNYCERRPRALKDGEGAGGFLCAQKSASSSSVTFYPTNKMPSVLDSGRAATAWNNPLETENSSYSLGDPGRGAWVSFFFVPLLCRLQTID
jgi:hypothetical protein